MHDEHILVAVDAALRSPAFCACGESLTITAHDDALWLECLAFGRVSRLPAAVSRVLRGLGHDRRFVVALPEIAPAVPVQARAAVAGRAVPSLG